MIPELHLPWLELMLLTPLIGALLTTGLKDAVSAWHRALFTTGLTLFFAIGAWEDFNLLHVFEAHDHWDLLTPFLGSDAVVIDELNAPLLPLAALLYFLKTLTTQQTKLRRSSIAGSLFSEVILLSLLVCREPWGIIALLGIQVIPPALELRARGRSPRVFLFHMALFMGLMTCGWGLIQSSASTTTSFPGLLMLVAALLIRSGSVPVHCWMTDLFENASFGSALLFVTPMAGAYTAVRLLLPIAPDYLLYMLGLLALITAVYAAGMALVQKEARRFFCYLFLSHSSLVMLGLEIATPLGLTGGLCVWLSVGMCLAGFGLTLRAVEARTGRLSLANYHGLHEHMPLLAVFFLLTGLSSIGFPGTVGFVGAELLVEGVISSYPHVGVLVVIAAALNGIAVLQAYFRIFGGKEHTASISLASRLPERIAVWLLSALIIAGGVIPQPGVTSRHHAALEIISRRPGYHGASPDTAPNEHNGHDHE